MDVRNIQDIRELRDMAREELNKDPDNRAMRLRQEAAQKNLDKKIVATSSSYRRSVARLRAFPSTLTTYM